MITNRDSPHIRDKIAGVPEEYQPEVQTVLDKLEKGFPEDSEFIRFDKYKIKVADGNIEIIFEWDLDTGNVRIVDIRERSNWGRIYKKIRKLDITPRP
jgi:hypothetical protein